MVKKYNLVFWLFSFVSGVLVAQNTDSINETDTIISHRSVGSSYFG